MSNTIKSDDTTVIFKNANGSIVKNDYMAYMLTPCCEASATGTTYGTACRACYNEIDSFYGMAASTNNADELAQFIVDAMQFLA
jgi:hypothetical protein